MNLTISKQLIALEVCLPRRCNGSVHASLQTEWLVVRVSRQNFALALRRNFEVSKMLYDISKLLASFRTCKGNLVGVYIWHNNGI